jgi:hypothetical protein
MKVYIATLTRIDLKNQWKRQSYSETITSLVLELPKALSFAGNFTQEKGDLPENHILIEWIARLPSNNCWCRWMETATHVSLYLMDTKNPERPPVDRFTDKFGDALNPLAGAKS